MSELKAQMRVEEDDEDASILSYGLAAENYVIDETRRSLEELCRRGYRESTGVEPDPEAEVSVSWFPSMLKVAVLLMAANLYRNREPVAAGVTPVAVPYTLEALVKPYVRLSDDNGQ
jgi:hypothetical protein